MKEEQVFIENLIKPLTKDKAFNELVTMYKERLYWHIRKIVLNHDDTDDVLQNTFIKVYRNLESFKGDSKLYTWMYRIATNEALTFIKKKSKRMQISPGELQTRAIENLKTDVYFEGDTIQLLLQQAIATLPEKQKLVFNMKYFESHTFEELSEILQTSVGGLKSSYHIAAKKVTEYLKSNETF
ncbi:DNA-directed RNA polymerase sigma-70 factor [Patiriisocius marinistellae]|uniref:DNA-directed RNA polymerase sigma-70 factor n=1 Tax=Patiriisocius marinistellae TaxID=2494560 RepID=A0A5J4FVL0_9FLAO|nr:RNA polymerase sigma factor [Patiriisocius marinistellae]GEQ85953.1 DNA-directed RNA polymerase sigma-70 factor [Patiriisocius marinistellae]